jgi:hypothetical protein
MFGNPFYHHTMKKVVASFGAIFANIFVIKRSENGNEIERIKVPLAYGPADRYLVRTLEDPDLTRRYAIKLPRMSFEIRSLQYDSSRKLNTLKTNIASINQQGVVAKQYQGVPYKISMELSIISKYIDDANQIVEQILPWFTPAFTVTINSIPGMNYKDDIPITLTAISFSDNYEDDWKNRRDIIWTLSFDIQMMFYGPVVDKSIITTAISDIFNASSVDLNTNETQNISRVSRSTVEVTPPTATFLDDFGFAETIQDFSDGKVRDPVTGEDISIKNTLSPISIQSEELFFDVKLI